MTAVQSIETFAASSGIFAFMNSKWGWPAAETVHFIGLALLIGSVGIFDLRALGVLRAIPIRVQQRMIPWGVAGFCVNVATGLLFFVSAPDQYLYNPAFQLKFACIGIAGINLVVFHATGAAGAVRASTNSYAPVPVRIMAAVSLTSWIGVIVFGRLITFYRPPEHWCFWC